MTGLHATADLPVAQAAWTAATQRPVTHEALLEAAALHVTA